MCDKLRNGSHSPSRSSSRHPSPSAPSAMRASLSPPRRPAPSSDKATAGSSDPSGRASSQASSQHSAEKATEEKFQRRKSSNGGKVPTEEKFQRRKSSNGGATASPRQASFKKSILAVGGMMARQAKSMAITIANKIRPVVDLASPAAAIVRTLLLPMVIPNEGPALFLVPVGVNMLLAVEASLSDSRTAACSDATRLLQLLPVPALRDGVRCIPAFEYTPVAGDRSRCVDRVIAAPLVLATAPRFDEDGSSWLHWVTLASLGATLVYAYAAHTLNRAHTVRPTVSRPVLDAIMSMSSRFRSGARAPTTVRSAAQPARRSKLTWAEACAESRAADAVLKQALLAIEDSEPHAATLRSFADRVLPFDEDEVPTRFKLDYGLPDFSDPRLFLTPFVTRVQPPRTLPLPPVPPQQPPEDFEPESLADLLTNVGQSELLQWYDTMYEWLLLVDELSPMLSRHRLALRRKVQEQLCIARADASDENVDALLNLVGDEKLAPFRKPLVARNSMRKLLFLTDLASAPGQLARELDCILHEDIDESCDDDIITRIIAARPEPLALGASRFVDKARGTVWDLRGSRPKPVDYGASIRTHLNCVLIKAWRSKFATYPDQEIFDHLLSGVRFKAQRPYQMILQPHLASLPLGYVNVHKELARLVDKQFFTCFLNPPFAPWQTLAMGVAFRKLELDRPRRTTDGGSPRRGHRSLQHLDVWGSPFLRRGGSSWLVDTDGVRVVPLNVASRWPDEDVARGTLDVFYQSWKSRLERASRPTSPPAFHPVSMRSRSASPASRSRGSSPDPPSASVEPSTPSSPLPVLLAFAGSPEGDTLGGRIRSSGVPTEELDSLMGADHNVLLRPVAERILSKAKRKAYSFIFISSPCKYFSVGADGRPQLFSLSEPLGREDVPAEWQAYVARGRAIAQFVYALISAAESSSTPWALENPSRRSIRNTPQYWERFADWGTLWDALTFLGMVAGTYCEALFAYCAFGADYQKFTTIWSSLSAAALVRAFAGHLCKHLALGIRHKQRLRGFDSEGASLTAAAARYPTAVLAQLCNSIVEIVNSFVARAVSSLCPACSDLGSSSAGQLTVSSVPAPPSTRRSVVDVQIDRSGPIPEFANPFKMGPSGTDGRLRGMAVATYREWLFAGTVRAGDWPTALPVSRRLAHLTGEDVERRLIALFEKYGRTTRFHFICGARCFGKACHGVVLVELARQILDATSEPPFPKEVKITVPENMNDAAVLKHLSFLTGVPVYQVNTDVADFFNQHYLHPVEQPNVGLITLDIEALMKHAGRLRQLHPQLCNVAESVLGYGLFPASEIAQRHAYLLDFIWYVEMLARSGTIVEALCVRYPVVRKWLQRRRETLEPKPSSGAQVDATAAVRFSQARLWSASRYTDDGYKLAFGVQLTVLSLTVEIDITTKLNLTMAIVAKQYIGQFVTNQGVRFHSGFGIAYVPEDKLRRTFAGIRAARAGTSLIREYHSTVSFLQSLLFIAGLSRSATFGLWGPMSRKYAAAEDELLRPTPLIDQQLENFERRLVACSGTSFEAGVERIVEDGRSELPPEARTVFVMRADASKEGTPMPGLGGALGGSGWRYPDYEPLSAEELKLHISVTEFAAFFGEVEQHGDEIPDEAVVLAESDALATVDSLTDEAARAPLMQAVFLALSTLPQWLRIRDRVVVAQCFGDSNVMADAFSRGYLDVARQLCGQLGMAYELRPSGPRLRKLMAELVILNQMRSTSAAPTPVAMTTAPPERSEPQPDSVWEWAPIMFMLLPLLIGLSWIVCAALTCLLPRLLTAVRGDRQLELVQLRSAFWRLVATASHAKGEKQASKMIRRFGYARAAFVSDRSLERADLLIRATPLSHRLKQLAVDRPGHMRMAIQLAVALSPEMRRQSWASAELSSIHDDMLLVLQAESAAARLQLAWRRRRAGRQGSPLSAAPTGSPDMPSPPPSPEDLLTHTYSFWGNASTRASSSAQPSAAEKKRSAASVTLTHFEMPTTPARYEKRADEKRRRSSILEFAVVATSLFDASPSMRSTRTTPTMSPAEVPLLSQSLHGTRTGELLTHIPVPSSTTQCPKPSITTVDPQPVGLAANVSQLLAADTSRLALRPSTFTLLSLCEQLYDPGAATVASTGKGQRSAWKHWSAWCTLNNTDPWRLERHSTDVDHFRESVLQAGFIRFVHLRQSVKPRNGRKAALPSSAAKTLAHIRKMHKDRDFPMVCGNLVQVNIRKLNYEYKGKYGVKDFIPKRKQPFTRGMLVDTILGAEEGTMLGNYRLQWHTRKGRSIRGITCTLAQTGFRKVEITVDKHGNLCDVNCLARSSLQWFIGGKTYPSGSVPAAVLAAAGPGDFAILTPPPSKSDPFDMVWGDKPIWLPFSSDALAAFPALADIELYDTFEGSAEKVAMFTDDDELPFSGSQLDTLLKHFLSRHFSPDIARQYSWHSARIFLACALLNSGATRAQIQAICRWQTEESLNVYAYMGADAYAERITKALTVRIDAARAHSLAMAVPFIDLRDVQHHCAAGDALAAAAVDLDAEPEPNDDADAE